MTATQPAATKAPAPRLRCRVLSVGDASAAAALLQSGFPERPPSYWSLALDRLAAHAAGIGSAAIGYGLEADGVIVGVLLLIERAPGSGAGPRCNVSSWYVEPRFAAYGPMLASQPLRRKDVTLLNISPAPHTWPIIEAQGFVRCSQGRLLAFPALMAPRPGSRVQWFDPAEPAHAALPRAERDLLTRHTGYGCLAICVSTRAGETLPFLVLPRRIKGVLPVAQLVFCRATDHVVSHGGPLGRFLLRHGMGALVIDLNGPLRGLPGRVIADRSPRYVRGPDGPHSGDLTDTELVMFGP